MNESVTQLDSDFDLKQSTTWDEMKELIDSENQVRCGGSPRFKLLLTGR